MGNENVLCWHSDKLYAAKICDRKARKLWKDQSDYNKQYMVHYDGWNKMWDEWVNEDKILPKTPQNIKLMEQNKGNGDRLENIHNLNTNTKDKRSRNISMNINDDDELNDDNQSIQFLV